MRYDKIVYFVKNGAETYDPDTGDYVTETPTETAVMASVVDTRAEALNLIYGDLKQGTLTITLQNHYTLPFDYIRIGNSKYRVDYRRRLRVKEAYFVSEVQ